MTTATTLQLPRSFLLSGPTKLTWIVGFYKLVEEPKPVWPDNIKYECMNCEGSLVLINSITEANFIGWEFQYNNEFILYSAEFHRHEFSDPCSEMYYDTDSNEMFDVRLTNINPLEMKIWYQPSDHNAIKGRYEGSKLSSNDQSNGLVMSLCFDWEHFKINQKNITDNNNKKKSKKKNNELEINGILEWRILKMPDHGENWYWYSKQYMEGNKYLDIIILEYVRGTLIMKSKNNYKIKIKGYGLMQPCSITYLDEYEMTLNKKKNIINMNTVRHGAFGHDKYQLKRSATKDELETVLKQVFDTVGLGQVNIVFSIVVKMLYDPISIDILPNAGYQIVSKVS
eukprot:18059_1